jgi:hypothetical protein
MAKLSEGEEESESVYFCSMDTFFELFKLGPEYASHGVSMIGDLIRSFDVGVASLGKARVETLRVKLRECLKSESYDHDFAPSTRVDYFLLVARYTKAGCL